MRYVSIMLVLVALGSGPAVPAEASDPCFSTHTTGNGATFLQICISEHGNIVQLESPQGSEHIRIAPIGEGYIVCSEAPLTGDIVAVGFDAGFAEENWGPATITQPSGPNTFPLTITRETINPQPDAFGAFRLKQTYKMDPNEKDVTLTMTLTNIGPSSRSNVFLSRYFDGDIDGSIADSSAQSADSAWAHDINALSLTARTFGTAHAAVRSKFANWNPNGGGASPRHGRFACRTFDSDPPASGGDFVGWNTYVLGTLGAGKSKTVKMTYRRY